MNKIILTLICIMLTGCSLSAGSQGSTPTDSESSEENTETGTMDIKLEQQYGNLVMTWHSPLPKYYQEVYDVELLSADPSYTPAVRVKIKTYDAYADALSMVGYYVQENNYDGDLYFRITAYQDSEAVLSEESEVFASSSVIPDKKELVIGTDLKTEDIVSFSYSGNGDSVEMNLSYGITVDDGEILYSADFHDQNGKEHTIEKNISEDDWKKLTEEIANGSMRLKIFRDPEIFMLDGSRQWFTLLFADMDPARDRLYEYVPEDREKLISILQGLAE